MEDSGYGISTPDIERLFEPFSQTESREQSKEGTELGLSISRNFARLMNGDITVSSERGKGSLFRFEVDLPVALLSQRLSQEGKVTGQMAGQPGYRVLVVDDKLENREVLSSLLKSIGFTVREASNGLEALEIWREWTQDLIWMDMRMKVMDGYTATEKIRTESRMRSNGNNQSQTVIIALTASAFEQVHERILAAVCSDIVTKPYLESVIFKKMEEHLGVRFKYEGEQSKLSFTRQAETAKPYLSVRLKKAPTDLLKQLHKSILQGSPDASIATINGIGKHVELLAEKLCRMVKAYQLDELIILLEKV